MAFQLQEGLRVCQSRKVVPAGHPRLQRCGKNHSSQECKEGLLALPVASCVATSVVKRLRLCQTDEALASTVQDSGDGLSSSSLPC